MVTIHMRTWRISCHHLQAWAKAYRGGRPPVEAAPKTMSLSSAILIVKCRDSRQTGTVVSVAERWQASRWFYSGAVVTRQVLGVGLRMSLHSEHKPPTSSISCCLHSHRWRRGPQTSEIRSIVRSVLYWSTCTYISGSGRRGSDIFPGLWSPHCRRQWRVAIHFYSIPTSEYRHPAWKCRQCRRNLV